MYPFSDEAQIKIGLINQAATIQSKLNKKVHFDSKNRVSMGKLSKNIKTYKVYRNLAGQLLFDPQMTIPASEAWVFQNPSYLNSLQRSLKEAGVGKIKSRGSFAKFVKEKD